MLFNTWLYGFFLAAVFVVYWALPWPRLRPYWLIVAGIAFYANYFPPHLALILGLAGLTFGLGAAMQRSSGARKRLLLVSGLTITLGALAYFKYQPLLHDAYTALGQQLPEAGAPKGSTIRAPLAISFFTFEFVHYLVEVYRGTITANFRDFILFIMFFPTLVAGPIKRYQNFAKYLDFEKRLDWREAGDGLERILFGLSKKLIVADTVARLTAPVWHDPLQYGPGILWLAAYGYAVQIYTDFSGYSDIAIGSAKLLGFKVEENFNWPYLRPNIREFWRSWHMSLTSWITDYLYIPLGGNRKGEWRTNANTIVSMSLCGLWHGAALHFIVWGFYHGVAICIQRSYGRWRDRLFPDMRDVLPNVRRVAATVFTFHIVVIGWMFFVLDAATATHVILKMLLLPLV